MDIKIISDIDFDEILYDKAYGYAKSLATGAKKKGVKFFGDYRLTGKLHRFKKQNDYVCVVIHKIGTMDDKAAVPRRQ